MNNCIFTSADSPILSNNTVHLIQHWRCHLSSQTKSKEVMTTWHTSAPKGFLSLNSAQQYVWGCGTHASSWAGQYYSLARLLNWLFLIIRNITMKTAYSFNLALTFDIKRQAVAETPPPYIRKWDQKEHICLSKPPGELSCPKCIIKSSHLKQCDEYLSNMWGRRELLLASCSDNIVGVLKRKMFS